MVIIFLYTGLLISGELYIHFKDKSVQDEKTEEMLKSIAAHVDKLERVIQNRPDSGDTAIMEGAGE